MSNQLSTPSTLQKDFDKAIHEMLAVMKMNCALNSLLNREDSNDLVFDSCSRDGLGLIHNAITDKCSDVINDLCAIQDALMRHGHE